MKNLFLSAALVLAHFLCFAQTEPDSVAYEMPPIEMIDTTAFADTAFNDLDFYSGNIPEKNFERICISSSSLLNSNGVFFSKGSTFQADMSRSWGVNVDVAEHINYANSKNEFGWGFAVSYGYQQIGLANNLRFHTYGNKTTVNQDSTASVTNNFRSFRLYVPLFIEYNYYLPKNGKPLHANIGANLGVRTLRYCIKEKTSNQSELRILDKTNMNYNYFIADVFLRVGVGNVSFFLTKSVLPLFNSNAGVAAVYPMQFGIAFGDLD